MLTESGMGMATGLALCLVGMIGLIVAIRQYRHKGSVFDAAYFAAPKPEREKLKTNKAYRYAGNLFLVLATACLLLGISFLFDSEALAFVGAVVALGEAGAGLHVSRCAGSGLNADG